MAKRDSYTTRSYRLSLPIALGGTPRFRIYEQAPCYES